MPGHLRDFASAGGPTPVPRNAPRHMRVYRDRHSLFVKFRRITDLVRHLNSIQKSCSLCGRVRHALFFSFVKGHLEINM